VFKTILVPVDLYAEGVAAQQLAVAKRFAEADNGKIIVLYVVPGIPGYAQSELPSGTHESVLSEAKKKLDAVAQSAGLSGGAELVMLEGKPARAILDHANETQADLIVMASHDPNLTDYLLGSTAARVVHHAHCSMFIVRNVKD
jgi:universal stress protein F